MLIEDIVEGVVPAFARSGNKVVKKYRCTSGPRKGRVVAKAGTCNAPKKIKQSQSMTRTRMRKGAQMKSKSRITKKTSSASIRTRRSNRSRRRNSSRRKKI